MNHAAPVICFLHGSHPAAVLAVLPPGLPGLMNEFLTVLMCSTREGSHLIRYACEAGLIRNPPDLRISGWCTVSYVNMTEA